jgi:hypothetical protein
MRSNPGPGGTLNVELDGMGVTWRLRPSAEGAQIVQHGGVLAGQLSDIVMVPERGFALTVLTNSEGGAPLLAELFTEDWALRRFAGVSNLPAEPRALPQAELAPYEGRYTRQIIDADGSLKENEMEIKGDNGQLHATLREGLEAAIPGEPPDTTKSEDAPATELRLVFYRDDYVLVYDESGKPNFRRADFLRGADGGLAWLRYGGRLYQHQGVSGAPPETGGPDLVGNLLRRLL